MSGEIIIKSIHVHNVATLALPKGPRGHECNNLGGGIHEYHNHVISLSPTAMEVEKHFQSFNTFSLGSEPLTKRP